MLSLAKGKVTPYQAETVGGARKTATRILISSSRKEGLKKTMTETGTAIETESVLQGSTKNHATTTDRGSRTKTQKITRKTMAKSSTN